MIIDKAIHREVVLMISYLIEGANIVKDVAFVAVSWMIVILIIKGLKHDEIIKANTYFITECIFCIYSISILRITGLIGGRWHMCESVSFNLIPLVNESPRLMLLNTLLFVPFGFLAPRLFKLKTLKKMVFVSLAIIVLIELAQMLFVGRLFDIDDLLFNILGAVIGYGLFHMCERIKKRNILIETRERGVGSFSLIAAIAAVVIGLPINNITIGDIMLYQLGINSLGSFTFRISEVIAAVVGVIGLTLGIYKRKDRYAYEGIVASAVSLVIAICNFRF